MAFLFIFCSMISIEALYSIFLKHPSVCTDTRKVQPGDLFFALKGENFNGNRFAVQALNAGAAYAIIDEPVDTAQAAGSTPPGSDPSSAGARQSLTAERLLLVGDVLKTLQQLAGYHRRQFTIPFIGITGSNGKTTTKELVHAVLATTFKTYTTEGNLNNHIGIPLTLLKVRPDAQMAVVEMGANHIGEIAGYCEYAQPNFGLITNTGKAHLEGFGSEEGVRRGKGELFDWLRAHDGTAFVMWDYPFLRSMSKDIPHIETYGTEDADIIGRAQGETHLDVDIFSGIPAQTIHTQLTGHYNLPNVLAAIAIGVHFGVTPENIRAGIENYSPSNNRSQVVTLGSNTIVLDAYNANPSSMKAAIENFAGLPGESKVMVLGSMAELGTASLEEHQAIIDLIKEYEWKNVLLVGGDFLKLSHPFSSLPDSAAAGDWLKSRQFEKTHFLIKGSRSTKMERALDGLK